MGQFRTTGGTIWDRGANLDNRLEILDSGAIRDKKILEFEAH